jgi:hypothetical protein
MRPTTPKQVVFDGSSEDDEEVKSAIRAAEQSLFEAHRLKDRRKYERKRRQEQGENDQLEAMRRASLLASTLREESSGSHIPTHDDSTSRVDWPASPEIVEQTKNQILHTIRYTASRCSLRASAACLAISMMDRMNRSPSHEELRAMVLLGSRGVVDPLMCSQSCKQLKDEVQDLINRAIEYKHRMTEFDS